MEPISYEMVAKLITADFSTGHLYWRERPPSMFKNQRSCSTWNARFAGKRVKDIVGSITTGYPRVCLMYKRYAVHRVIWLLAHGEWPPEQIDHINGKRNDNRLENLRAVSIQENRKNHSLRTDNTSGVPGVSFSSRRGQWLARIINAGKIRHLGYFDEFEAAVARRKSAEIEEGFHPNHGRKAA